MLFNYFTKGVKMNKKLLINLFLVLFSTTSFASEFTIEMLNDRSDGERMVYSEDITKINVGDTIKWVPTTKNHNVHFLAGPEGWEIPKPSKLNAEYSYTFEEPGIYYYQCTPHDTIGMIALIVVGDDISNKEIIAKATARGKSKIKLKKLINQL